MKKVLCFLILLPLLLRAQPDKGILFEEGLTWQQVKEKAKKEDKYIFVDCYATWCKPCKLMDTLVYDDPIIGRYINSHFVSIKLQFDTTKKDNKSIKKLYQDSKSLLRKYNITVFPTYLFFDNNGDIVHRALGLVSGTEFIKFASDALNPQAQYYALLENYREGKKNYTVMPYLAKASRIFGNETLADSICRDYINNYLLILDEDKLYTKENMEFIGASIRSSKDKSFALFYNNGNRIDTLVDWTKKYSQGIIDNIILKEEVASFINLDKNHSTPNWNKISKKIRRKYNIDYANRNVLTAKIDWYHKNKNWSKYLKCVVYQVERYGVDTTSIFGDVTLNNIAFDGIFFHSTNKAIIKTGIKWMEGVLRRNPKNNSPYLDTYANLLYKIGRRKDAIAIEEKAVLQDPKNLVFGVTLAKMKLGQLTWMTE